MHERIWNRNFIFLISSNFLMYITYYAILSALPLYLVNDLHASEVQVGFVVGAYTIASVMARPFSGFMLDRFGRRTIFLLALIIYSLLFAGYFVALTITGILLLRFAQGLTWGFTTVSGSTIAVDIIPVSKGRRYRLFCLVNNAGDVCRPCYRTICGPSVGISCYVCFRMCHQRCKPGMCPGNSYAQKVFSR